jgi:hypothetical protein
MPPAHRNLSRSGPRGPFQCTGRCTPGLTGAIHLAVTRYAIVAAGIIKLADLAAAWLGASETLIAALCLATLAGFPLAVVATGLRHAHRCRASARVDDKCAVRRHDWRATGPGAP